MKAILTKLNRINTIYLSAFLGFIIISWIFWIRFFRFRLPRDIPFDLTLLGTIILGITCIAFIFIIKIIIKPPHSSLVKEILIPLSRPMINFHTFVSNNSYFELLIFYSLKAIVPILKTDFYYSICYRLYYIFHIFFRVLLLSIFYIDVLYFHQIKFLYSFILLGLISPLMSFWYAAVGRLRTRYIFWLDQYYEVTLISMDPDPEKDNTKLFTPDGIENSDSFTIDSFLGIIGDNLKHLQYRFTLKWNYIHQVYPTFLGSKESLSVDQKHNLEKIFHKNMPALLLVAEYLLSAYKIEVDNYQQYSRYISILLYTSYFLLWFYILLISLPTFHVTNLELGFIEKFIDMNNPFIDTTIENLQ